MRRVIFLAMVVALGGCASATVGGYGQGGQNADGRSYAQARADNLLKGEVTRALVRHSSIDSRDISVASRDGVVTLTGTVPSQVMVGLASRAVGSVPGVHRIENRLRTR